MKRINFSNTKRICGINWTKWDFAAASEQLYHFMPEIEKEDIQECYKAGLKQDMEAYSKIISKQMGRFPGEINLSKIFSNSTIEITSWIIKENCRLDKAHVDLSMSMTLESLASLDRAIHPVDWPYQSISCNCLSNSRSMLLLVPTIMLIAPICAI